MEFKFKIRGLVNSFRYAGKGIRYCLRCERNFRIHIVMALFVSAFSLFYDFTAAEKCILALTFGMVMTAEVFNTAIEYVVDHISQAYSVYAKVIKDVSAGAVLLSALSAIAVGIILFADKTALLSIIVFFMEKPYMIAVLALDIVVSLLFIFYGTGSGNRMKKRGKIND